MIASVYSTLSGTLAGEHPTLGVWVRVDGMVKLAKGWSKGCSVRKDGSMHVCVDKTQNG